MTSPLSWTSTTPTPTFTEDEFLTENQTKRIVVYLQDGYRIIGVLKGSDQFTITVSSAGHLQLIYKSSIANIIDLNRN
jgi:RNA chaperone Hfq